MLTIKKRNMKNKNGGKVNARNWPWMILIDPDIEYRAAVWAQEYAEARMKWNPLTLIRLIFKRKEAVRDIELFGHEVEVQAAGYIYHSNMTSYRRQEVQALKYAYKEFDNVPLAAIDRDMRKLSVKALAFVMDHLNKIEKWK